MLDNIMETRGILPSKIKDSRRKHKETCAKNRRKRKKRNKR